jgi:hypothetical protein
VATTFSSFRSSDRLSIDDRLGFMSHFWPEYHLIIVSWSESPAVENRFRASALPLSPVQRFLLGRNSKRKTGDYEEYKICGESESWRHSRR